MADDLRSREYPDDEAPTLNRWMFRMAIGVDSDYAGWAIQDACGLVPLTTDERHAMRFARGLRRHNAALPEVADRKAHFLAFLAEHDSSIAERSCYCCKRYGRCPATTHLHSEGLPYAA